MNEETLPQYIQTKKALKWLSIITGTIIGTIEIINATTNRTSKIYIGIIIILGGLALSTIIETANKILEQTEEEEEKQKWNKKKNKKRK